MDNFFVNNPFTVTQNAMIYTQNVNTNEAIYDYILSINILAASLTTMNSLFNNRTYIQSSANQNTPGENNVDINLSINVDLLNNLFYGSNAINISSAMINVANTDAYLTLKSGDYLLGLRFLEIVATKIFGHARARAAIANDTEYYLPYSTSNSIIQQIIDGMNNSLVTRKSDIFNVYVNYDRIENNPNNDVDQPVNFNFDNTNWEFPLYFISSINSTSNNTNLDYVNNGPYVGGNVLTNGIMNVPILLRFHATP